MKEITMEETTFEVTFRVKFCHNKEWSYEDLYDVAKDLVSHRWPYKWSFDGMKEWHIEHKDVKEV